MFSRSKVKRQCRKCNSEHGVGYITNANGSVHLSMWCDIYNTHIKIPFEDNLDCPSVLSGPAKKNNDKVKAFAQSPLFEYSVGRHKTSKEFLPKIIRAYEPGVF